MDKHFLGGCHCGFIRYVVRLDASNPIYRCNCRICHKSGLFHIRPAPSNFTLLSPTDTSTLSDYQCHDKVLHFYFCKTCGVRCFTFMGDAKVTTRDLSAFNVDGISGSHEVWQPIEAEKNSRAHGTYISVNGHTIDADQGFDMRELVDNKTVIYYDYLFDKDPAPASKTPHKGGCY